MKVPIMSANNVLSIRLPAEIKKGLDRLASSTNRSKSNLAAEAIGHFVDVNTWQVAGIKESIKAADRGEFIEHDAVEDWVNSWDKPKPLAKPKPV